MSRRAARGPRDVTTVRKRRPGVKLGVATVVVLGLVAGLGYGDMRLRAFAEEKVSASVQNQLGLDGAPRVDFAGRFFGPQVAQRRFDAIDVYARDVEITTEGFALKIDELDLTLRDVTTTDFESYTAGRLTGTARVRWTSAEEVVHVPVRDGPGGRIRADYDQRLMGQSIRLIVSARPVVDEATQTFHLDDASATVQGYEIPDVVVQEAVEKMVKPTPISLPLGLRATGVRSSRKGLELDISGTDVRLNG
ncbi:DUF2993 family protein [Propioniferax innocua]|uniref:DUF2993 family protein n=1 Tax=Propioniferax innocua TaxID=1753 RepID=A0A542ZAR7_9ACTN|nr:DUF2993 family protein [Propioniferax innocua]